MAAAIGSVLSAHMTNRAAGLMHTGERKNILSWFGAMLEANVSGTIEHEICPSVPVFEEINKRGGTGCRSRLRQWMVLESPCQKVPRHQGNRPSRIWREYCSGKTIVGDSGPFGLTDIHRREYQNFAHQEPAGLIAMNRALHQVRDEKESAFRIFRDLVTETGAIVIWEAAWSKNLSNLRGHGETAPRLPESGRACPRKPSPAPRCHFGRVPLGRNAGKDLSVFWRKRSCHIWPKIVDDKVLP